MACWIPDDHDLPCISCKITFDRKILPCQHSVSKSSLEELYNNYKMIACPICGKYCPLPLLDGVDGLLDDLSAITYLKSLKDSTCIRSKTKHAQTYCTSKVACCFTCKSYLCKKSAKAHQDMPIFKEHKVMSLKDNGYKEDLKLEKLHHCLQHKAILGYFCKQCNTPVCRECINTDHHHGSHSITSLRSHRLSEDNRRQVERYKAEIKSAYDTLDQYLGARSESGHFRESEHRSNLAKLTWLSELFSEKFVKNAVQDKKMTSFVDRAKISDRSNAVESSLSTNLKDFLECNPELECDGLGSSCNLNAVEDSLTRPFDYIYCKQEFPAKDYNASFSGHFRIPKQRSDQASLISCRETTVQNAQQQKKMTSFVDLTKRSDSSDAVKSSSGYEAAAAPSLGPFYEKSSGHSYRLQNDAAVRLPLNTEPEINTPVNPPSLIKIQIDRLPMAYYRFFGEFGEMEGQFTEPNGLAVNSQLEIVVADTNNHRIQIFDKEGGFKFTFGNWGKSNGQLAYPNMVAVWKKTGDIVITERSPTRQIQIYNQYGQFQRKFGNKILQSPRAVTVDDMGRIIVVECKVMKVWIFDKDGNELNSFIERSLGFPNGVAVNDREEIFISDNKAHCVKVFDYAGHYLREIGGEGITDFPIGVGINENGYVIIADNHCHFNITVFNQQGILLYATKSKAKHSQLFGMVLLDNESVVVSTKDYRLFIYNYLPSFPSY